MSHLIDVEVLGLAGRTGAVRISFDRHVNVLFGANGSGKTSLLKLLHSAMTGDTRVLRNVPFIEATVRIESKADKRIYTRTITRETHEHVAVAPIGDEMVDPRSVTGRKTTGPLVWAETPARNPDKELTRWRHSYLPTSRLHVSDRRASLRLSSKATHALTEEALDEYFALTIDRLWESYNATVLREVGSAQERGLASILKGVLADTDIPEVGAPSVPSRDAYKAAQRFLQRQGSLWVLGTYEQFKNRYERDESLKSIVSDISKIEADIDLAMAPRRQLEALIRRLYSNNKTITFSDSGIAVSDVSGGSIGLESLSSGERHLLRILIESIAVSENTLIVDEPELSMHVDWQRELIEVMYSLNSGAQYVLATHSPEIMAELPDERIVSL